MRWRTLRGAPRWVLTATLFCLAGILATAENIDPDNDGSQFAWAENVGWINAEPAAPGDPGVLVSDFELSGYLWGENIGWISLSCKNGSTCDSAEFGVANDGDGVLSGYAWSENAGWINFAPATAGVVIDVTTGDFSGHAWGENIGWITFAASGAHPFKVTTGWTCDPAPSPPSGSPSLFVGKSGTDGELSWTGLSGATGFDIVEGSLGALRSSGGDFSSATDACLSSHNTAGSLLRSGTPAPGEGFWYLVRGENCGGNGTHDSAGPQQVGVRDAEMAASGKDCQ